MIDSSDTHLIIIKSGVPMKFSVVSNLPEELFWYVRAVVGYCRHLKKSIGNKILIRVQLSIP
jgi:hypothetical protein